MDSPFLVCVDGSELSAAAVERGLAVLDPAAPRVLVTVLDGPDPAATMGTGHAGPTMTGDQYQEAHATAVAAAEALLDQAASHLDLPGAPRRVLDGAVGPAICALAAEIPARAIVIGSRGRGGLARAVLGSVSDHVVRNALCPVVVASSAALGD